MTKSFDVTNLWQGETVAVLGAGPSLTAELAESVREFKTIAASRAVKLAPWADALVTIDGNLPVAGYAGMHFVGVESDGEGLFVGMPYEVVTLGEGNVIHIRNNALSAIRIAAQAGAAKILLLGMDTERYEEMHNFAGLTIGLAALIDELQARGIKIMAEEVSS